MFRKNTQQQQPSFFNSDFLMPEKLRQQLYNSWAHTFRHMVFANIPEECFATLYSEVDSRPNAPVNVLVGGDMLKSGFGWTDEELESHLQFDLQTRYALGLDDLSQSVPTVRTFQNLRRRVREHAEENGENLYQIVFETVTDEQVEQLGLKMGWQRMDSTQLLSNIALVTRLELVLRVLQQGVAALPPERQAVWQREEADYVSQQPRHICYRLKDKEVPDHLQRVGQLLVKLLAELEEGAASGEARGLVARVLREQYEIEENQPVKLRPAAEVAANSLQSPHDPDATYREKNGERYRGYVTNISETCDPENPVQLITSLQTASNNTDDGQLLAQSLAEQKERGYQVEKVTVDGGYTGPTAQAACGQETELHPSRVRGGKSQAHKWGWEEYSWQVSDEGIPEQVSCPGGQVIVLQPGRKANRWLARFEEDICADCPFFQKQCRVEPRRRTGPTLLVTTRSIQVALLRQRITSANNGIRAAIEATVRSVKHPFPGGKLPVRGLIRAHMVVCGSAMLVNVHRLCRYFREQASRMDTDASITVVLARFGAFIAILSAWYRRWLAIFAHRPDYLSEPSVFTVSQSAEG
jgi:hypothetical protein